MLQHRVIAKILSLFLKSQADKLPVFSLLISISTYRQGKEKLAFRYLAL